MAYCIQCIWIKVWDMAISCSTSSSIEMADVFEILRLSARIGVAAFIPLWQRHFASNLQARRRASLATSADSCPVMADSPLCETCSAVDLNKCLREGGNNYKRIKPITLGALTTIISQKEACGLCRMISLLISRNWRLDLHPDEDLALVQVQLDVDICGWPDTRQYEPTRNSLNAHCITLKAHPPLAIHQRLVKSTADLKLQLHLMEDDAGRFGRERAFHRRRVGAEVSIERVRKWLRICEKEHGQGCAHVWPENATIELPQGVRMIDVVHMAVVEAPRNCRYVALSYVWGKVDTEYETRLENMAERQKRGSLKSVGLPRTILDAIKLVQELKERYLWVDVLCIVQDDPVNKDIQIAGMHMIYGMAILTIIAAGGNSANAPLPGLQPGSRQMLQHIESIQSLQLAVPLRKLAVMLGVSKWDTRGWTFQEQILSRRKLFFTQEQLFFKCQRDVFAEDMIVESGKKTAEYEAKFQGPNLRTPNRPLSHQHTWYYWNYATSYMEMIEEYTRRQLTIPADIYNAIFAIITVFSRDYELTPLDPKIAFLYGMPISLLEDVMLWQPVLDAPVHVRRCETELVTPSWSWAGWEGSVEYYAGIDDMGYTLGQPGSWRKWSLVDEWVIGDPDGVARRISTERPRQTQLDETLKYLGLPLSLSSSLVAEGDSLVPGMLLFRTTAAFLRLQKKQLDLKQVDDIAYSVFNIMSDTLPRPDKMGRIVLPSDTDTTVLVEFVVLSRAEGDALPDTFDEQVFGDRILGCLLNVMAVKRVDKTEDGMEISERVGVGVIADAAWSTAKFCERVVRLQ